MYSVVREVSPFASTHSEQIHEAFKTFVKEQIRAKLEQFEGSVKNSKVKSRIFQSRFLKLVLVTT